MSDLGEIMQLEQALEIKDNRCAELERENAELRRQNTAYANGDVWRENKHLRAKASMLEAQRDSLEVENTGLKDTVQILNNRVRFRDAEIQKLRAAMPPAERLRVLADWFDMDDKRKGRTALQNEVQRDLRSWASRLKAALSEQPGAELMHRCAEVERLEARIEKARFVIRGYRVTREHDYYAGCGCWACCKDRAILPALSAQPTVRAVIPMAPEQIMRTPPEQPEAAEVKP